MDKFEKKYGIKENQTVKDFHKSRRMFCIYKNALHIAPPNVSYSHAVWFENEGWHKSEEALGEVGSKNQKTNFNQRSRAVSNHVLHLSA